MVTLTTASKGVRHDWCICAFRYEGNFDEQAVRKIAETARATLEGMPGLRSKAFTLNSAKREATNFCVWTQRRQLKRSLPMSLSSE
jgi:hypothetical protein